MNLVMSNPEVAARLSALKSFNFVGCQDELDVSPFVAGLTSIPGQFLVKLRAQGDALTEREFLAAHGARLLRHLPLPGRGWQEQSILHIHCSSADVARLQADPRVSYAAPNTVFTLRQEVARLNQGTVTTTNAARLLHVITSAERRGMRIKASSLAGCQTNLAVEDALRRCAHCVQVRPQQSRLSGNFLRMDLVHRGRWVTYAGR